MKNEIIEKGNRETAPDVAALKAILPKFGVEPARIDAGIDAMFSDRLTEPNVDEPLLTPRKLCEALSISNTSLWRLGPPYHRVGRRKRYVMSEVMKFLEEQDAS